MKQALAAAFVMALAAVVTGACLTDFTPSKTTFPAAPGSHSYTYREAIQRGDVVYMNQVYNLERFAQFLAHLANQKADSLRITGYTDEGDPIFADLNYDGKIIHYTVDNSNDAFGGQDKGVRKDDCARIARTDLTPSEYGYVLEGCKKNNKRMSYFLLRVDKNQGEG